MSFIKNNMVLKTVIQSIRYFLKPRASGADKNTSNLDVESELKTGNYIADTFVRRATRRLRGAPTAEADKILGDCTGSVLNDGAIDLGSTEQQAGSASKG